ncbi:MAG: FHA domain-containing protein, partial [Chroococcales cyanobacterium]
MTELMLRLHIEGQSDRTVKVAQDEFRIGRLPECDLCLPFSEISRHHTRFFRNASGEWLVEDLGSTNGTILNKIRLTSAAKVKQGDAIQLGNILLFVILNPFPESQVPVPASNTQFSRATEISRTILRNAEELQQQWLQLEDQGNTHRSQQTTIERLKDLVEIAKGLSSAESIEAIFSQVQKVVFRELKTVDHLALLIDVNGLGELELINAATRDIPNSTASALDDSWISHTICQNVFTQKIAIKTVDAQNDERFVGENSILAKGICGAMAVPLWDKDQVVGVLYADANFNFHQLEAVDDEDLSFFSTLANLVASSVQRWLLARKLQGEAKIRQKLERYHSPAVVQQLIAVGALEGGRIKPIEADITILFADLVGFSALSERLTPSQISQILNRLFEEMLKPVFAVGGTLDKFIGDCIMAFFGAPESQPDHADRAVAAAKGMLDRLDQLNAAKVWAEPLQLRIAINSGKAVV